MRRYIKCPHPGVRVMTFKATTVDGGTDSAINVGTGDLASYSGNGANGTSLITFQEPFGAVGAGVIAQAGAGVADGGFASVPSASTITGATVETRNAAGTLDSGVVYFLAGGLDGSVMDTWGGPREAMSICKSTQHQSRALVFKVRSNAITEGKFHGTISRASAGVYTITFTNPFACTYPRAFVCPVATTKKGHRANATTAATVVVHTFDAADAAADVDFDLIVVGQDTADETCRARSPIHIPQRGARVIFGGITTNATYSSSSFTDYSYAAGGAGVGTVTWGDAFKRAPVIIASGIGTTIVQQGTDATTTGADIRTFNTADAATSASAYFLAIGFDETDEY